MNKTRTEPGKLQRIPSWVFLGVFLFSAVITLTALRSNNQQMIKLREAVYTADKDNKDVNAALNNLRGYVYGHMNTSLSSGGNAIKPPIQLKYTYQRLQAAEQDRTDVANTQVYTDAQSYCQIQNPVAFSGRTRVPCVTDYVTTHGTQAKPIAIGLYQFDFISPAWSPDFAGWSLVVTLLLFVLFVSRIFMDKLVSTKLRNI
jgi:hypothetical protein